MRWWSYRRYSLWVINTDKDASLYKWDNWKLLMPSIDKLLTLTKEKAFIKTSQSFEFENKWLGFGRMIWDAENNEKWTTKYRTTENEARLQFYGTEIWAPDWNQFDKSGVAPDIFVKLYNNPTSTRTKEGLIIAIPRRLSLKQRDIIEIEISRLTELIPNSTLTMTTRLWYPWLRFVNNIEDMNPQELEKILNEGKR
ncbi:MAG TPA: hypothetical protein VK666_11005 [Chryseolinea sp.]|nr:hypothetical protein [Chryseolinea sp.]